jgi:transcriptional regulator with XRE-family HTH domain
MDNQFKIKPFRKKRRTLTLEDKKNIIENREKYNQSFEELADLYGVDRSTVSKIVKAKFTYLNAFEKLTSETSRGGLSQHIHIPSQEKRKIDLDVYEPIEKMLAAWLENAQKNKLLITKGVLLEKAKSFFYLLKQDGCALPERPVLNSWLNEFVEKFNVLEAGDYSEGKYIFFTIIIPSKVRFKLYSPFTLRVNVFILFKSESYF